MSGRKLLLTFPDPPPEFVRVTKDSLARKLKGTSNVFDSGVFFSGAETTGGNSLGGIDSNQLQQHVKALFSALFPIVHLGTELTVIKDLTEHQRRLVKSVVVAGSKIGVNQAIYVEKDQVNEAWTK